MKNLKAVAVGAALSLCAFGAAHADLIEAEMSRPITVYNSTGVTTYNASNDMFSVDATLLAMQVEGVALFLPLGSATLAMDFKVDSRGRAYAGVSGPDFRMQGSLDSDGDGIPEYSGTLLTGEIRKFGYQEAGATDEFDAEFEVTGGSMAGLYGKTIAVTITSEFSTFSGNFCRSFTGGAKGNIGNKGGNDCPKPPSWWKQQCRDLPSDTLTIGGVEYNYQELVRLLNQRLPSGAPAQDDVTVDLARYIIAAKLSFLNGAVQDQEAVEAIAVGDIFLAAHPIGSMLTQEEEDLALSIIEGLEDYVTRTDCGRPNNCYPRNHKKDDKKGRCGWRDHGGWGGHNPCHNRNRSGGRHCR